MADPIKPSGNTPVILHTPAAEQKEASEQAKETQAPTRNNPGLLVPDNFSPTKPSTLGLSSGSIAQPKGLSSPTIKGAVSPKAALGEIQYIGTIAQVESEPIDKHPLALKLLDIRDNLQGLATAKIDQARKAHTKGDFTKMKNLIKEAGEGLNEAFQRLNSIRAEFDERAEKAEQLLETALKAVPTDDKATNDARREAQTAMLLAIRWEKRFGQLQQHFAKLMLAKEDLQIPNQHDNVHIPGGGVANSYREAAQTLLARAKEDLQEASDAHWYATRSDIGAEDGKYFYQTEWDLAAVISLQALLALRTGAAPTEVKALRDEAADHLLLFFDRSNITPKALNWAQKQFNGTKPRDPDLAILGDYDFEREVGPSDEDHGAVQFSFPLSKHSVVEELENRFPQPKT